MLHFLKTCMIFALLVSSCGCAAMFNAKPIPGVPQPADRIEQIRELGENADRVPEAQKQQYAETLSTIIREETDGTMRREAVLAISRFKVPITEETLRYAQKDPERDVREAVCRGWLNYGGDAAVVQVIEILGTDSDLDVRHAAIDVLGELKDERGIVPLEVPLTDPDPALKHYAILALQKITGLPTTDQEEWIAYCQARHPGVEVAYQPEKEEKKVLSPLLNLFEKQNDDAETEESEEEQERKKKEAGLDLKFNSKKG